MRSHLGIELALIDCLILARFVLWFAENVTASKVNKRKAEDEDKLTQEGHELKGMLERDKGEESWDEDEDEEDPDRDEQG